MRLKYVIAVAIAAVMSVRCTEPVKSSYFEGTITSMWIVKDVFQNSETIYLSVDDPSDLCDANVEVSDATTIRFVRDPFNAATKADLHVSQLVRVEPPFTAADNCPMDIDATAVWIVH